MEYTHERLGWHQLQQADRDRMETLLDAGQTQREIAKLLKVHESTVSREKKRQRQDGRYDAETAERKARLKRADSKYQGMKVEGCPELKAHLIQELAQRRSPDEIAGRMRKDRLPFYASKNAIYKWLYSVYGQRYCPLLCTKRYRRRRQKRKTARTMIPNRTSIDLRPLGATNKTRYGHFEGDTIVAPKKALNTEGVAVVVERKTKLILGTKIPSLAPRYMAQAMDHFSRKARILSATLDNGIENKDHEEWIVPAYFADPHSPWQKPVVENAIGLLRRWSFPKGTDWDRVSEVDLQRELLFVNNKYRKSLAYQSALEVAGAHGMLRQKYPRRDCN